jgi:molecular chaperone HscB
MKKAVVGVVSLSMSSDGESLRVPRSNPDFFTILGVSPDFDIDQNALHRAYIQLQQRFHPDRFARATDADKLQAMQASADANHAYTTLKDPLLRIEYLLAQQGIVLGDRPDAVKASQALLVDSMQMREALFEAQTAQDIAALKAQADAQNMQCMESIAQTWHAEAYAQCAQAAIRLRFLRKFQDELKKRGLLIS